TVWRNALGVEQNNEGTLKLRSAHFLEPWAKRIRRKAHAKNQDPERCAKIAAAKRGKPRPRHVIEAMIAANRGRKHTPEHRKKMSEEQKRRRAIQLRLEIE